MVNALSKEKGLLQQQLRELQQSFEEQQEPFKSLALRLSLLGAAAKLHGRAPRLAGAPASARHRGACHRGAPCRGALGVGVADLRAHVGALRRQGTALAQRHGGARAPGLGAPPAEGDALSLGLILLLHDLRRS